MNDINSSIETLTWLNSKEAAIYLRTSVANIRVLVCRGVIKPYKFNNRNRFNRKELDAMIKSSINGKTKDGYSKIYS